MLSSYSSPIFLQLLDNFKNTKIFVKIEFVQIQKYHVQKLDTKYVKIRQLKVEKTQEMFNPDLRFWWLVCEQKMSLASNVATRQRL